MNRVFYKKFDVYINGYHIPNIESVDIAIKFHPVDCKPLYYCDGITIDGCRYTYNGKT